jgi:hypothetical protein
MKKRFVGVLGVVLAQTVFAPSVQAQGGGQPPQPPQPQQPTPRRMMGQGGNQGVKPPLNPANPAQRAFLENQIRQRLGNRMREALGLNDAQMQKLGDLTRRYEEKHRILQDQERDVRMSLRDEVLRSDTTRGAQMTQLLDRYIRNERQRVDLAEQEQKELSSFLTPLQRAKYFGLQEVIRNQIQNLRQQAAQMRQKANGRPNGPPMGPNGRPNDFDGGDSGMGFPGQPGPDGPPNPAEPPRPQGAKPGVPPKKRPPTP